MIFVTTCGAADNVTHGNEEKPSMIHNYNMNDCDKVDQRIAYYGFYNRRFQKRWKKIFFWIIEISVSNAFAIFKLVNADKKFTLKDFKDKLIGQLVEKASAIMPITDKEDVPRKRGRKPTKPLERLEGSKHIIARHKLARRCKWCSKPGAVKRTHYFCDGSSDKSHLCIDGRFLNYHKQSKLPD